MAEETKTKEELAAEAEATIKVKLQEYSDTSNAFDEFQTRLDLAWRIFQVIENEDAVSDSEYDELLKNAEEVETDSALVILSEFEARLEQLQLDAKTEVRALETPVKLHGYKVFSRSGGVTRSWDIPTLVNMGYGDIVIGNVPLIQQQPKVNLAAWNKAIKEGVVDPEAVKNRGAYLEKPKTRSTFFEKVKE